MNVTSRATAAYSAHLAAAAETGALQPSDPHADRTKAAGAPGSDPLAARVATQGLHPITQRSGAAAANKVAVNDAAAAQKSRRESLESKADELQKKMEEMQRELAEAQDHQNLGRFADWLMGSDSGAANLDPDAKADAVARSSRATDLVQRDRP